MSPDGNEARAGLRDEIAEVLAHWPIGSGYYSTGVSYDEAREMADAVLAVPEIAGRDECGLCGAEIGGHRHPRPPQVTEWRRKWWDTNADLNAARAEIVRLKAEIES